MNLFVSRVQRPNAADRLTVSTSDDHALRDLRRYYNRRAPRFAPRLTASADFDQIADGFARNLKADVTIFDYDLLIPA